MKFRKLFSFCWRTVIRKNSFYEDIIFEDKHIRNNVQECVETWFYRLLKYRGITIGKFKDLFSQLQEISFPIKINKTYCYSSGCLDICFVDSQGKEYYMLNRDVWKFSGAERYVVGRKNSSIEPYIDRSFYFKIYSNYISLLGTTAILLRADGTNDDTEVKFSYNYVEHTTEVTLNSYIQHNKIIIKYPTVNNNFDKELLEKLLDICEIIYNYCDVIHILEWITEQIKQENISIFIVAKLDKRITSQIQVVDGIVQQYTKTKINSKNELHTYKKIVDEEISEFIKNNLT